MSIKIKGMDIKTIHTTFLMINFNIKNFDSNNIKIDKKSYKNLLIYYIGYVRIKDSKYVKINSVNTLWHITKPSITDSPLTIDNRPPTHRQVLHHPTNHQQPATDLPTDPPQTRRPTNTNLLTHRPNKNQPTNHRPY